MRIGIASDHRGYKMKQKVTKYLKKRGYDVVDYGTNSSLSVDYPDFAILLGEEYMKKSFDYGIGICANGVGMSIACNKVKGVRCAKVNTQAEVKSARRDDDINIISIPSNLLMFEVKDIIDAFLGTPFSTDERYSRRIKKLKDYEDQA